MEANSADVLAVARGEIGTVESPRGSNRQKYGKWYGMDGQPWCAMFVSWVFWHAGYPLPPIASRKGFAYVPDIVTWAKRDGTWNTRRPVPGDIVVYKFGIVRPNHVGLVETVNGDGSIVAIEGNTDARGSRTGGQVMRQRRRSGIHGYVAVADTANPQPQPKPDPDPEPAPQVDPAEVTMFIALDNGRRYAQVGTVIVGLSEADYQRCYAVSRGVPVLALPGPTGEAAINASNAVAKATATGKAQPWAFDRRK